MSSSKPSPLGKLISGFFGKEPKKAKPAAAEEPPLPAPKKRSEPAVIALPKGLNTELRKAVKPGASSKVKAGRSQAKPASAPAPKSISAPKKTGRPGSALRPSTAMRADMEQAPAPLAKSPRSLPKRPKTLPPETRFREKDHPIV